MQCTHTMKLAMFLTYFGHMLFKLATCTSHVRVAYMCKKPTLLVRLDVKCCDNDKDANHNLELYEIGYIDGVRIMHIQIMFGVHGGIAY